MTIVSNAAASDLLSAVSDHPAVTYPAVGALAVAAVTYGSLTAYRRRLARQENDAAVGKESDILQRSGVADYLADVGADAEDEASKMATLQKEWETHRSARTEIETAPDYPSIAGLGRPMDSAAAESRREFFLRYNRPLSVLFDDKKLREMLKEAGVCHETRDDGCPELSSVHHTDSGLAAVFHCRFPTSLTTWTGALPLIGFSLDAPDIQIEEKMSGSGQVVLVLHDVTRRDEDMRTVDLHRGVPALRALTPAEEFDYEDLLRGKKVRTDMEVTSEAALTVLNHVFGYEAASWVLRTLGSSFPMTPREFVELCGDVATAGADPEQSRPFAGKVPEYDHPIALPLGDSYTSAPVHELESASSVSPSEDDSDGESAEKTLPVPESALDVDEADLDATYGSLDVESPSTIGAGSSDLASFVMPSPPAWTTAPTGFSNDEEEDEDGSPLEDPVVEPADEAGPVVEFSADDVFVGPGPFVEDASRDDDAVDGDDDGDDDVIVEDDFMETETGDDTGEVADAEEHSADELGVTGSDTETTEPIQVVEESDEAEYGTSLFTAEELRQYGIFDTDEPGTTESTATATPS